MRTHALPTAEPLLPRVLRARGLAGSEDVPPGEGYRVRTSTSTAMPTDSTVPIVAAGHHSTCRGMMGFNRRSTCSTSERHVKNGDNHRGGRRPAPPKKSKTSQRLKHICWHIYDSLNLASRLPPMNGHTVIHTQIIALYAEQTDSAHTY